MGFWTNKVHRTAFDDAEDLAYPPSGGRLKMWLLGIGLALIPVGYGIHCLRTRHALLFGQDSDLDVTGSGAVAFAIAYIAVGIFIHAHWFWGLLPKFGLVSYALKFVAVLLFLGSFGYGIYRVIIA
jgi:hypothetical protein